MGFLSIVLMGLSFGGFGGLQPLPDSDWDSVWRNPVRSFLQQGQAGAPPAASPEGSRGSMKDAFAVTYSDRSEASRLMPILAEGGAGFLLGSGLAVFPGFFFAGLGGDAFMAVWALFVAPPLYVLGSSLGASLTGTRFFDIPPGSFWPALGWSSLGAGIGALALFGSAVVLGDLGVVLTLPLAILLPVAGAVLGVERHRIRRGAPSTASAPVGPAELSVTAGTSRPIDMTRPLTRF